jgi:Lon protease-like protein
MSIEAQLRDFSGVVPIFPLPKAVLFPGTRLPLHIFEPRYRQMITDAIERDSLVALALPKKLDENDIGKSTVHQIACLGHLRKIQKLPDGRYLLQLQGLQRLRIVRELTTLSPYREAFAELLPDEVSPLDALNLEPLLNENLVAFNEVLKKVADLPGPVLQTQKKASVGLCLDIISYYLPTDSALKQKLLEENNVLRRGQLLLTILEELKVLVPRNSSQISLFPRPSRN